MDHVEISLQGHMFLVLVIVGAASNLVWAGPQKNKTHQETLRIILDAIHQLNCKLKAVCAENYFQDDDFAMFYSYHAIKTVKLGPHTPWPNRTEAAVKIFKHSAATLADWIKKYEEAEPVLTHVTVRLLLDRACWARNTSLTYGSKTPLEIATGRRPPDVIDLENMLQEQLVTEPTNTDKMDQLVRKLAMQAHLETRQRIDIRKDLLNKLLPSQGPYKLGDSVWYCERDTSKIRSGEWIRARVCHLPEPPMVGIQYKGQVTTVNQSKLRRNPDPGHAVVIPGLDNRDAVPEVPLPERGAEKKHDGQGKTVEIPTEVNVGSETAGPSTTSLTTEHGLFTSSVEFYVYGLHSEDMLPTERSGLQNHFQQYYSTTEKVTAFMGLQNAVGIPVRMDNTFTDENCTGIDKALAFLRERPPMLLWISP